MGTLVVIFVILMLIGFIIEFLKKCGTVLGYIVIAILAIIAIIALFPLIIKLLPYIIAIFAVYFVIHAISNSNTFVKKRANSYLKKLDNKGMDQPEITPKYENSFKWTMLITSPIKNERKITVNKDGHGEGTTESL